MPERETPNFFLPYPTGSGQVHAAPTDLEELAVRLEAVLKARSEAVFKPGDVKFTARPLTVAPAGWLICDGSFKSVGVYRKLWEVIGYTFGKKGVIFSLIGGGGGTGEFALPDYRAKSPAGADGSAEGFGLGATGGSENVRLGGQQTGIPHHRHPLAPSTPLGAGGVLISGGQRVEIGNSVAYVGVSSNNELGVNRTEVVPPTQANEAHENMPPFMTGVWLIKT